MSKFDLQKSLKERVQEFNTLLPFMDGRDKGDLKNLIGTVVTVRDYGFLTDTDTKQATEKEYVCFITDEDSKRFYFGGQVLTDQLMKLDEEGYHGAIVEEGIPVLFGEKKSKNNRAYTTVEFYPNVPEPTKKGK